MLFLFKLLIISCLTWDVSLTHNWFIYQLAWPTSLSFPRHWIWDRRKQLSYTNGSAYIAQQINPSPLECVVNGTECYDGWVWAIYLFIYYSKKCNSNLIGRQVWKSVIVIWLDKNSTWTSNCIYICIFMFDTVLKSIFPKIFWVMVEATENFSLLDKYIFSTQVLKFVYNSVQVPGTAEFKLSNKEPLQLLWPKNKN